MGAPLCTLGWRARACPRARAQVPHSGRTLWVHPLRAIFGPTPLVHPVGPTPLAHPLVCPWVCGSLSKINSSCLEITTHPPPPSTFFNKLYTFRTLNSVPSRKSNKFFARPLVARISCSGERFCFQALGGVLSMLCHRFGVKLVVSSSISSLLLGASFRLKISLVQLCCLQGSCSISQFGAQPVCTWQWVLHAKPIVLA